MAEIRISNVDALGKPVGPYSHIARVKAGADTLYIAGMLASGETFEAQCAAVYGQIEKALQSAGGGWANVVQFTTYLVHSRTSPSFTAGASASTRACFPTGATRPIRCSSSIASSR